MRWYVLGATLDSYAHHEGLGQKSGNTNVTSLIMMFLKQKNWLREDETEQE